MDRCCLRASWLAALALLSAGAGRAGAAPAEARLAVLPFAAPGSTSLSFGQAAADSTARGLVIALRGRAVRLVDPGEARALLARLPDGASPHELLLAARAAGMDYVLFGRVAGPVVESRSTGATLPHPLAADDRPVVVVRTLAPGEEERTTRVSVLARLVTVSTGASADIRVDGKAIGRGPDPRGALEHASTLLARAVRARIGRGGAPLPAGASPGAGIAAVEQSGAAPSPTSTNPAGIGPRDGWVLEAESPDAVAVKIGRSHGLEPRRRLLMRWKVPVAGDSTVRRTVQIYDVEVAEADTAGVILRVLGEDRRKPLPPSSEMVVLEPR